MNIMRSQAPGEGWTAGWAVGAWKGGECEREREPCTYAGFKLILSYVYSVKYLNA